jgi:beta-glucosidase
MYKRFILILFILAFFSPSCNNEDPVSPPDNSIDGRVSQLLEQMNLDEKIGQMTQVDRGMLQSTDDIKNYYLGSLLSGGGSAPADNSPSGWADMYDYYQSFALATRLKIPLIYGIDAVHGHNNVKNAVIFPHNIGLGSTRNPVLVQNAARVTATEVAGTGIDWTFAPCIAVARDEKWGRTYESFGETPELQVMMAEAYVNGLQGTDLAEDDAVLACAKHFVGDGGTLNGKDQGNTICDETTLRNIHLPGYIKAIDAGVGSIMVSYSSWNGMKLHAHKYLVTELLKNELGFKGFVVSDWAGVDQLSADYKIAVEVSINAGIDMVMVPGRYKEFISTLKQLVQEGKVSEERINDAVRRILKIKFQSGLFDKPLTNRSLTPLIGSQAHRDIARQCVRESLVLLKNNNNILPLTGSLQRIHVSGKNANDLGNQCGGWTISWQGNSGDITTGTTFLQGLQNNAPDGVNITYSNDGSGVEGASLAVVVIGETPYAEMMGDRTDLSLSTQDINLVKTIRGKNIPVIAVIVSGRPMILNSISEYCDAIVAAWLPGTEGDGVAEVLYGEYDFKGTLPHSWPRSMDQIPLNTGDSNYDPLYPYGYGLKYSE